MWSTLNMCYLTRSYKYWYYYSYFQVLGRCNYILYINAKWISLKHTESCHCLTQKFSLISLHPYFASRISKIYSKSTTSWFPILFSMHPIQWSSFEEFQHLVTILEKLNQKGNWEEVVKEIKRENQDCGVLHYSRKQGV